ncbi:MAG: Filamentous hemagglutinin family outer membrane protein [Verrucomicrobiales bacterium]|nr:Filamentous hemagglutinin family outer membrane protein [Verrucomicrobiales bacterium]
MRPTVSNVIRNLLMVSAALPLSGTGKAWANPDGMDVVRGTATTQVNGSQLSIQTGQHTFLDWRSFNIQKGESTTFVQPGANSIVFNRINDTNPSQIWGNLSANGTIILANAHGFYFGPGSMISVGGSFISTTAPITPDLGTAGSWQFTGLPPLASIINYGQVEVRNGGSLYLIAETVENHGSLKATDGRVGLYAGKEVLLSERPDGRGLSAMVKLPSGSVDNSGKILADAGAIALHASVVNQNGILQADSVRQKNGIIELVGSEEVNLGSSSQILARGDASGNSPGGNVLLKSDFKFQDRAGSEILTTGGANGGTGGNVEVSAHAIQSLDSHMDAGAHSGSQAGKLLLDPQDIILGNTGAGSAVDGTVLAAQEPGTLQLNVNTAFANKNFSQITLQATRNITLAQGTVWDLSKSTGVEAGENHLVLQAGNNIIFENNARILDANNWSVRLEAGVDFSSGAVQAGIGSVFLNGGVGKSLNGSIETARGAIEINAGRDVLVSGGFIRTILGGSIHVRALSGDVDAGKKNDGYEFSTTGYRISLAGLGGIATAAGGDVILEAGHDVISTPTVPASKTPGASGTYGADAGDLTVIAGHQIFGNFLVRNGRGTLLAGMALQNGQVVRNNLDADIGSATKPVSLSLISGSWNAWAARDIFLSEVRNPNGTFNPSSLPVPSGTYAGNIDDKGVIAPPDRTKFLFDYAPDAAANFWAGNGIHLLGANLPRINGQNQAMKAIYPPRLSLDAGSGGIELDNSLILFPSALGQLNVNTREGGDLTGRPQQSALVGIIMSDSGLPDYTSFGQGHALSPLHLNDANPVRFNISGSVENFSLTVPTFAEVNVAGNTYNFGFLGQNLSPSAVTRINIGGDVRYRGNLTSVSLGEALPPALFDFTLSGNPQIALKLRHDATTGKLTYIGQMTDSDLAFLLAPQAVLTYPNGVPVRDENGDVQFTTFSLSSAQKAAIQQLHDDSQSASLGDQGLALAGPGKFRINARNMDLGISGGITTLLPAPNILSVSPFSADIEVNVAGNLDMTSTKVANQGLLGGIVLKVGGKIDVGGQFTTFGDSKAPKGIFTTSGGNISVQAEGDVNLNGSRIATYNGGNISVKSLHGDINAGSGGAGYVSLNSLELDPSTGELRSIPGTIPGSGILATTLPGSSAALGNISVDAAEGNINASLGGIIQLAFNNFNTRNSSIDLHAGQDINASGSGIIGSNIRLSAGGNISGVIIGSQNIDISTEHNVNVTAFSAGGVSINAGGNVSGTVVGGGNIAVSGDAISAALVSKSVSASGDTSSATVGVPQSASKAESKISEDASTAATKVSDKEKEDEEETKKKAKTIGLVRKTGRVTVILPNKN